jgi:hypothetical protein
MKNKFYLILLLFISIAIVSCDDAPPPSDTYTNGVFVINEGAFGSSNSELSFIASDNSVYNGLYANNNSSAILGDVFQSMHIANGKAYLVINNSSKIEVVSTSNLQNSATISGALTMPRYMVSYNGKGYVSDWVSFGSNGKVYVIDLSNNTITDSVTVGMLPEQMMVVGTSILVANSSDTTLHLINTTNLATTNIGDVDYPKNITKTSDGNIWVLYTGKPSWAVGGPTDGGLLVLNPSATGIVKTINIGSTPTNPSQLATDGNNLYYEYQGSVYKIDKSATVAPGSPFISSPATSFYGLNYYSASNTLYIGDAKTFASAGVVKRYDATSGALIDTLNVGVAPNGFVFN